MLDNIAGLLLMVGLLAAVYQFPPNFALRYMVPGTAIGVLVGDLLFFWLALRLAHKSGRDDVTAMPLGLDTPSTFGMVFFVLGPAFQGARAAGLDEYSAALHTWHIGICAIFISGWFKLACAFVSGWIRRRAPRAGLLGSLAAVALVLISFLPLMEILQLPLVGLVSLAIILTTLIAHVPFPGRVPGALAALLVGGAMFYVLQGIGLLERPVEGLIDPRAALFPTEWFEVFTFRWLGAMSATVPYLPVILPFALGTVVGGIDCTESAAAAGDEYDTGQVIGVEAIATLLASLCGGVIQTTPYIGHPAYKTMGGRSAYTLVTALFVGAAGVIGFFAYLYVWIPKPAIFPILIFIGLEITAQSFQAVPKRHYAAVAFACIPALAFLGLSFADRVLGDQGLAVSALHDPTLRHDLETLRILSNGFIVTSLLWASALTAILDRRLSTAATFFLVAGLLSAFGIMHSPYPGGAIFFPWQWEGDTLKVVLEYVAAYLAAALLLAVWDQYLYASENSRRPATDTSPSDSSSGEAP
jgi:adenine/guanine/hypoxanthine permease